jgi:hypothetical protein
MFSVVKKNPFFALRVFAVNKTPGHAEYFRTLRKSLVFAPLDYGQ